MQLRVILAASDLRAAPDQAIDTARCLAGLTGTELHVMHCVRRRVDARRVPDHVIDAARRELEARAPEAVSVTILPGVPHRAIRNYSEAVGADIMVLGPRMRHSALDNALGSTADRVLRTTRRPTLLANGTLSSHPTRILVPVDESESARRAVTATGALLATLARRGHAAAGMVHLLHVDASGEPDHDSARHVDLDSLAAMLESRAEGWRGDISYSVDTAPFVDEGILTFSESFRPDLVVMGTRADGLLVRALFGSVALDVARVVPRPLLLIPQS